MANESATTARIGTSYVEWGAIIAGAIAASALSFVLLTSGASIGLSLLSPFASQSFGSWAATLAAAWVLMVTIGAFLVGGYIAGRMRSVWGDANEDEVVFRDGIHGMLVWCLSIFIGGTFASIGATTATLVGAEVGRSAIHSFDSSAALAPTIDVLLRATPGVAVTTGQPIGPDLRDEVTRALSSSTGAGQVSDANRTYLSAVVAQRTGLPPAEADKRVTAAFSEAIGIVEGARKTAVMVGLITATALLFGLAAAWYAAQRGGHHRDHNIPARFSAHRKRSA